MSARLSSSSRAPISIVATSPRALCTMNAYNFSPGSGARHVERATSVGPCMQTKSTAFERLRRA
jgi:hypothetical protein